MFCLPLISKLLLLICSIHFSSSCGYNPNVFWSIFVKFITFSRQNLWSDLKDCRWIRWFILWIINVLFFVFFKQTYSESLYSVKIWHSQQQHIHITHLTRLHTATTLQSADGHTSTSSYVTDWPGLRVKGECVIWEHCLTDNIWR